MVLHSGHSQDWKPSDCDSWYMEYPSLKESSMCFLISFLDFLIPDAKLVADGFRMAFPAEHHKIFRMSLGILASGNGRLPGMSVKIAQVVAVDEVTRGHIGFICVALDFNCMGR